MTRILVISEDEALIEQVRQLEEYEVLSTSILEAAPYTFDIVLLDVTNRDKTQIAKAKQLIAKKQIVIYATSSQLDLISGLLEMGVVDYLIPPFNCAMLKARIENAKWRKFMNEFMAFTSSELKNPLTTVRGYTDTLLKNYFGELQDQQYQILKIILANADRLGKLIDDARDIIRAETGHLKLYLNLHRESIEEIIDTWIQFRDENSELRYKNISKALPVNLPYVQGDKARLTHALQILIENAQQYAPEDSPVTISASVEGDYLRVSVADNGYGIQEDEQARIFVERYFRSNDTRVREIPGVGLGHTFLKAIIEAHGGEVGFESEFNKGSTFYFTIPIAKEE